MKDRRVHRVVTVCVLAAMAAGIAGGISPATASAHGVKARQVTEKMLKTQPDKNYKIQKQYQGKAKDAEYVNYFLKEDIQTVSLTVDKNNLDYLFQNGSEKPTVMADSVKIGDETYGYVGLKTKGNYTLDHTYNDNVANDRFSFSINFGKYITKEKYGEDQNFHGCDKISFNNFYFDKSMLKEYFALKLLNEMGLPAPQYGLAKVYINGKFYGVYSMIENMQKSILKRYLSVGGKALSDYLVKPTHTNMQYDENMDSYLTKAGTYDLGKDITTDKNGLSQAKGVLAEQSGLWENNEDTLTKVKNELPRVFTWQKKLTLLSQGKDSKGNKIDVNSDEYIKELEQVMDVEEVVKYFATHSFLVQNDNMFVTQQNFGLYVDKDGKSMLLPWDYDLSFGCYYPSTAEATANLNIDQMYKEDMGGEFGEETMKKFTYADYPLFQVIYQNKELMKKYHQYMKDCSKIVLTGGTVTDGQVFEAGRFYASAQKLKDKLFKAAAEPLASNVEYLNYTEQPRDVKIAFPNITKILALRSAGVISQVDGLQATVSGYGCNLESLGNAVQSRNTGTGTLAIADAATGIYLIGDYSNHGNDSRPPSLTAEKLDPSNEVYQKLKKASGVSSDEDIVVYSMSDTSEPKDGYKMYLPIGSGMDPSQVSVYCYTPEGMKYLESSTQDRTVTADSDSIRYVAVVKGKRAADWVKWLGLALVALAVIAAVLGFFHKKRQEKRGA